MIDTFSMNGRIWSVIFVNSNDQMLIDRTGVKTLATTDASTNIVYLSNRLRGDFLFKVFIHELSHCAMVSYGLNDDIHRMVRPEYWIDAEEWVCNFLADYGLMIFQIGFNILGYNAWMFIPTEFDKIIA